MSDFRLLTRFPENPNAEAQFQSQFFAYSDQLRLIQEFLADDRPRGELKQALGIIKNIASKYQEVLRRDRFLNQIVMLFRKHHNEMQQKGPLYQQSKFGDKIIDIIEPCVICVQTFVHDPRSKMVLFGPQNPPDKPLEEVYGVIDMLTDLLLILNLQLRKNPSTCRKNILLVMKVTTNILMEIAQDKEGAFLIDTYCESKEAQRGAHPLKVLIDAFNQPKDNMETNIAKMETNIAKFAVDTMNQLHRVKNEKNQGLFRPSEHIKNLANLHRNNPQGPPLPPQVCKITKFYLLDS